MGLNISLYFILVVPLLVAGIHFLEFTATLARISGIASGKNMLGYTIQQSVYVGTRFLIIFLLPVLGYLVDSGVSTDDYQLIARCGLLFSSIMYVLVFVNRKRIVGYYCRVIADYGTSGRFIISFVSAFQKKAGEGRGVVFSSLNQVFKDSQSRLILCLSAVVFSVYSSGMFVSFYFALINPDYRATISQLSGIFNSAGTLLLTFVIEPIMSRSIDEKADNSQNLVVALLVGRFIGVAFVSQIFLSITFLVG